MTQVLQSLITIWRHRRMLLSTTWVELRRIYAGSALGMTWAWLGPLILLSVYAVVYAFIFRVRPLDMGQAQYVLFVFAGLGPFLAFSQALTMGASSLGSNRQLLLNTIFPADLLPIRTTLIASASLPITLALVVMADLIWGKPSWTLLLLPFVVIGQFLFSFGLAWLLSLFTLLLRDIQQILQYATLVLMVVTPIAYTPSMIPARLKFLIWFNPLTYFVSAYQDVIVLGRVPPLPIVLGMVAVSVGVFSLGSWVFGRTKREMLQYA